MKGKPMAKKPRVTLPGTVEKVIKPSEPGQPEKVQIEIEGADEMYREIRIENTLTTEDGKQTRLKKGSEVDVTVEADSTATNAKKE